MKLSQCLLLLFILPLLGMGQNKSDDHVNPLLSDRFLIKAGLFLPSKNIELGANGSTPNDLIDFDETFDLRDNQSTFYFQFNWKFSRNRKWIVAAEYFGVNNANRVTLEEDIDFKDLTFEAGTFVRAGIEFKLYRVFFSYDFLNRPKHVMGAGIGTHLFNVGAFIEGEVRTSEGDLGFERRRVSSLLPLPNVGGHYYYGPHPKWMFGARVDWFGISIDKYSGGLWNVAPMVNFQIVPNFGIGIDYRFFFVNARISEEDWNGKFEMDFSGPLFTIHGNF